MQGLLAIVTIQFFGDYIVKSYKLFTSEDIGTLHSGLNTINVIAKPACGQQLQPYFFVSYNYREKEAGYILMCT